MEDIWKPIRTHLVKFNVHSLLSILGWPKSLFLYYLTGKLEQLSGQPSVYTYIHIG